MEAGLTATDVERFEATLRERYDEIDADVDRLRREANATAGNAPPERPERSMLERDHAAAMRELARQERLLESIRAALGKVSAGVYGRCDECAAWIERERLEVVPEARFCVACERVHGAGRGGT